MLFDHLDTFTMRLRTPAPAVLSRGTVTVSRAFLLLVLCGETG